MRKMLFLIVNETCLMGFKVHCTLAEDWGAEWFVQHVTTPDLWFHITLVFTVIDVGLMFSGL